MDVFWVDAVDAGLIMFFRDLFGEENQKLSLGHRWHLTFFGVRLNWTRIETLEGHCF